MPAAEPTDCLVDAFSAAVPESESSKLSAGAGPRIHGWVRMPIRPLCEPGRYWLLVRRSLPDGELAHCLCLCLRTASLDDLVASPGAAWRSRSPSGTPSEVGPDP